MPNLSDGHVTPPEDRRARAAYLEPKSSRQETVMEPPPPPSREEAPAEKRPLDAGEDHEVAAKKQRLADPSRSHENKWPLARFGV